jgi:hypothetical protein
MSSIATKGPHGVELGEPRSTLCVVHADGPERLELGFGLDSFRDDLAAYPKCELGKGYRKGLTGEITIDPTCHRHIQLDDFGFQVEDVP